VQGRISSMHLVAITLGLPARNKCCIFKFSSCSLYVLSIGEVLATQWSAFSGEEKSSLFEYIDAAVLNGPEDDPIW
jgi:hypothetical protein